MSSRRVRWSVVAAVVLLAAGLRLWAVARLPVDFDEPVYTEGGLVYAAALRAGDLRLLQRDPAPEHPGLVKLLYGGVFLLSPSPWGEAAAGPLPNPLPGGEGARALSAAFGVLHVLLLALVSPVAGALLAVHSYTVKYTAQVYLEAVPMFMASVCVLASIGARFQVPGARAERSALAPGTWPREPSSWRNPLLWSLSAVALGLAAAGKYVYAVAGLAVAADSVWRLVEARRPRGLLVLLGWGGLALLVFLAANPYLWPDPLGRLFDSLAFHAAYSQGAHVQQSGYPWYQPFVWLVAPLPVGWHPGIIITPFDPLTAALGVGGLRPAWRAYGGRGRVIVLWWAIGLAFTLLWSTKWPQYSLIMTAPMCLCAGEAVKRLAPVVSRRWAALG